MIGGGGREAKELVQSRFYLRVAQVVGHDLDCIC